MDKLETQVQHLIPNLRRVSGDSYPVYGMGQPTKDGIKNFMQTLKDNGFEVRTIFLSGWSGLPSIVMYNAGPSLRGHSLERTPSIKDTNFGQQVVRVNACGASSHQMKPL